MLRSLVIFLFFVVLATSQNAWKKGKEYTYKVRSRTLATVNPQSMQYSGILMEARLIVQSFGQDNLRLKVLQVRYSPIHTRLENGWESEISETKMKMGSIPLSEQPFEVRLQSGLIDELIINEDVPTWEVNILKSIVSQLQVDAQGQNADRQSIRNQLFDEKAPFTSFKSMEDSVGGKCQVLYDISPLREKTLQTNPEVAWMPLLRKNDEIISLVKTKNFSHCTQRVGYHFGVNGRNKFEPGDNDNGKYLSRSSVSHIVISGNLESYTIQSSVTNNKVVLNPGLQENQQGMVVSQINVTLVDMKDVTDALPAPSKPQSVENLVYNYNDPFESYSSRRPNKANRNQDSSEHSDESSSESDKSDDGNSYLQVKPTLSEAPRNPMLPFFVGINGNSIQNNGAVDVVKSSKDIAWQIGNDMQRPDSMQKEQTLEKFTILSRLIRTMNAQQIEEVHRELYDPFHFSNQLNQNQSIRKHAWIAFRDAVANAGTGPALVNIMQWIMNKKVRNTEAALVVNAIAKSAQTPTSEFLDTLFEIIKMPETKQQPILFSSSIMALADLCRHAIVNKKSAHNRYPIHAFRRLFSKNKHHLHEKYIPYMSEELKEAVKSGDSEKILVYTVALGRIGDPRILQVFEPYIEGWIEVNSFQRLVMVMSLDKLANVYPKIAQSVLYKIYSNNADHHEIRCAAVFLLMKTNPPASMLQRMAESTHHETSKHVNSAVKSSIESLAQLDSDETREISDAAKAALPLLTTENFGIQYSRAVFKSFRHPRTHSGFSVEAKMIGSDDSIIPKGVSFTFSPIINGLKLPKINVGGAVSTVQDFWNFVEEQIGIDEENNNPESRQKNFSPENVAKLLGIRGDEPRLIEGFIRVNEKNLGNLFFSFDNHTLTRVPQMLKELQKFEDQEMHFDKTKFDNYEVTISFPTETGFPLSFTLETPTIMSISGKIAFKNKQDSEKSPIPKSATVNGKIKVICGLRVQKRLGFVMPFDHREFMVGIDRNMELYLPVRSQIDYDMDKKDYYIKVQFDDSYQYDENGEDIKLIQVETSPFIAINNITSLRPIANDKNTFVFNKAHVSSFKAEQKDENNKTRIRFEWETEFDYSSGNKNNGNDDYVIGGIKLVRSVAFLAANSDPENTKYEKYSIKVSPSNDLSLEMRVLYDLRSPQENNSNYDVEDDNDMLLNAKAPTLDKNLNEIERKQKLLEQVAKNINSAEAVVVDASLKVNGVMRTSANITAAIARSEIDQRSRLVAVGSAKTMLDKIYHGAISLESKIPNLDHFDYEQTLKANTGYEYEAEINYGLGCDKNDINGRYHTIKVQGNLTQSEEHKNEIRQSREAEVCSKHKQKGNKMTYVCQKLNKDAAKLNKGDLVISFEDESSLRRSVMSTLDSIERMAQMLSQDSNDHKNTIEKNKVKIAIGLSNKNVADISLKTSEGIIELQNIDLSMLDDENSQSNENVKDRQNYYLNPLKKSCCSLDKSEVKTFDNKRFSVQLGQCWHVAMTPYPKNDPHLLNQQVNSIPENMQVSILVKEIENGDKKMKITMGEHEIELSPSSSSKPEAMVDGSSIKISKKRSNLKLKKGKVVFELFRLFDHSIKLVSDKYNIEVIYDGVRAKIETGERYRKSVRGLCGNDDGEPENDQQTPNGCQLQKPEEFAATWAFVTDEKCQGSARQKAEKAKNSLCTYELVRPGNVISDEEAGRMGSRNDEGNKNNTNDWKSITYCMYHRTKVQKMDDEICFSMQPIPVCSSTCHQGATKIRNIDMYCVTRSSAAEKVAQRVESGVNPDLTQKNVSKTVSHEVPFTCLP